MTAASPPPWMPTARATGRSYVWEADEARAVLAEAGLEPAAVDGAVAAYWICATAGTGRATRSSTSRTRRLRNRATSSGRAPRSSPPRSLRVRPGRHGKQPAAWKRYCLARLRLRGACPGRLSALFVTATRELVRFVRDTLLHDGARLWRTARDGVAHTPGFAEDYAAVADGLLEAYGALANPTTCASRRRSWDGCWPISGMTSLGRCSTPDPSTSTPWLDHDRWWTARRPARTPWPPMSGCGSRFSRATRSITVGHAEILAAVGLALERQPTGFGRMLSAADRAGRPATDVVVAGEAQDERSVGLRRRRPDPMRRTWSWRRSAG